VGDRQHGLILTAGSDNRSPSLIARVGGEEFGVIETAARDIHRRTDPRRHRCPADRAPVTASVGVTTLLRRHLADPRIYIASTLEQAIAHADHAMFTVKRQGGSATAVVAASQPVFFGVDAPAGT
jgi:GGDEF domain-containing protein